MSPGAGSSVVDQVLYVGLVDAHSEGVGGHDDLDVIVDERLVCCLPLRDEQICVIFIVVNFVFAQLRGDFVDILPAGDVDDGGARELPAGHHLGQV